MHLNELKAQHVSQLLEMAAGLEIENANRLRKQELMAFISMGPPSSIRCCIPEIAVQPR